MATLFHGRSGSDWALLRGQSFVVNSLPPLTSQIAIAHGRTSRHDTWNQQPEDKAYPTTQSPQEKIHQIPHQHKKLHKIMRSMYTVYVLSAVLPFIFTPIDNIKQSCSVKTACKNLFGRKTASPLVNDTFLKPLSR